MTIAQSLESLVPQTNPGSLFGFRNGKKVSTRQLLAHACEVSRSLPEAGYAINFCSDRYLFTVAYLAVVIRKQINLLPSSQSSGCIQKLLLGYPGSYRIVDSNQADAPHSFVIQSEPETAVPDSHPLIDPERVASISFTSGSTGNPTAIEKTWAEFIRSARLAVQRLGLNNSQRTIISTVPPQHMYGLETSVFWPLSSTSTVSNRHPFFPEDIRLAIERSAFPVILVTTPTHLKNCVDTSVAWKNISMILSSTAPMSRSLATQVESRLKAPLYEIFGSTETLSYASRRPAECDVWIPYNGVRVMAGTAGYSLEGGHLKEAVKLDDALDIDPDGGFTVTGRSADLIKIAGKRASLTDLNETLNAIDGVREGCFYPTEHERLGALVVTELSNREIVESLRNSIDAVFLPRPLHRVDRLPRNELGKLPKTNIDQLVKDLELA